MIQYLGNEIIRGNLDYTYVVTKRTDLKTQIDEYLLAQRYGNLIAN